MLQIFYLLKETFLNAPEKVIKPLIIMVSAGWCIWHFFLQRPLYQFVFGKKDNQILTISNIDQFIDMPTGKVLPLKVNGYDIEVQLIKGFSTTTKIVYVDRYTKLGTWYRSMESADLYDAIVPQDISFATGNSGRKSECFDFSHEYRCLFTRSLNNPGCPAYNHNEISNNHVIANSYNIQKGIDILKPGDIAKIEGYLVYWNGTGSLRYARFESAIYPGQISSQRAGGLQTGLCRQLLITKLSFDGYTFE